MHGQDSINNLSTNLTSIFNKNSTNNIKNLKNEKNILILVIKIKIKELY